MEEQCRLYAYFYDRPADWNLLLTQLGLDEKRKCLIQKLSGGEKQRLSILLSLIGRPKLLVLDDKRQGLARKYGRIYGSAEKLYLMTAPKTAGLTMEGII